MSFDPTPFSKEFACPAKAFSFSLTLPSPAGRGKGYWGVPIHIRAFLPVQRHDSHQGGERFSLSQRERAGVRESCPYFQRFRFNFNRSTLDVTL
jgi:hypothetical protein